MQVLLDIDPADYPALLVTVRAALENETLARCTIIATTPDAFLPPAWQPHPWPKFDSDRYRK